MLPNREIVFYFQGSLFARCKFKVRSVQRRIDAILGNSNVAVDRFLVARGSGVCCPSALQSGRPKLKTHKHGFSQLPAQTSSGKWTPGPRRYYENYANWNAHSREDGLGILISR